jgi:putative ABC transport system permease protein
MLGFRRSQRDFEVEIQSHIDIEADRLIEEGMNPHDARLAARRRFGNVSKAQERYHDAGRLAWLEQVMMDVRYASRMLRKSPGFTAISIFTLAVGIGANTAVFSVVNGVLLSPLPYREPERLVKIWESLPGMAQIMVSYPDYKDWKVRARVFDDIALYSPFRTMTMTGGELPERVGVGLATANLFGLLGVSPIIGRDLHADDDQPGAARVALATSGFWKRRFGSDPGVLGKTVALDGETYKIIGVTPPTVGLGALDVWVPMGLWDKASNFNRGNHPGLIGVGRLKPGVTIAQMNADLMRVSAEIRAEYPTETSGIGAGGDFLRELLVGNIRPALKMLSWAVFCVLLIACVNVANLLLGRSSSRRKEIALRVAVGASDARIVRLLLTENLMVALTGGVLGVGLAYAGVKSIVALKPVGIPRLGNIHIDLRVLVFAAVVSIVTGLVFGLLPARQAAKVDLNDSLKESGRGSSATGGTLRLRGMLMAVEVAMALMLLVGAGLLMRSFTRLARVESGVDPRGVVTAWVDLPEVKYPDEPRQRLALQDILRRVQSVPGVTAAALTSAFPLNANQQNKITFEGHPRPKGNEPLLNVQYVSPDYFSTVKMRVIAGRGFSPRDVQGAAPVVWISETVAKKYFPGENAVGKRLVHGEVDSKEQPFTVAGVVNDVKETSLGGTVNGTLYLVFDQFPQSWMGLAIKTSIPFEQVMPAVRREVAAFDKDLPLRDESTLERTIGESIGQERFTMFVLGIFATVALLLAAVGVYGVIAYFVAQRSHEIGIRMALGAQRTNIVSLVTGRVLVTTGIGVVVGLVAAAAASGLMTKLLYDVKPTDMTTYAGGAMALLAVACVAAVVPTLRATRVNPATTMRSD